MFKGEGTSGDHHKAESTEALYWTELFVVVTKPL